MTASVRAVSTEDRPLVTEDEFDAAQADTSVEAAAARAEAALTQEVRDRLRRKRADRIVEQLLREEDAAGQPTLRSSVLDFVGLMNLPDPRWLVDGMLPDVALSFLAGRPGSFKSFVALHIAVGVATGTDVFGSAALPGDVLYVAAEGAPGQKKRVQAQADRLGRDAGDLHERFRLLARPVNLLNERHVDELVEVVSERETRLVVVDTLARCTPGANEQAADAMGLAVAGLSRVKDVGQGCCVLVVHHSTKAGDPLRGSSALEGAADSVHVCTRAKGSPFVTVSDWKQKDAEERPELTLEFTKTGTSGLLTTSSTVAAAHHKFQAGGHRMDMILTTCMSNPGRTLADLVLATGTSRPTVTRDVADLISRGLLERTKVDGLFRHYVIGSEQ